MVDAWLGGMTYVVVCLVLPAVAIALTWPNDTRDDTPEALAAGGAERTMIAFAVPITAWVIVSELFARLDILNATTTWTYGAIVGITSVAIVARNRVRARERFRAFAVIRTLANRAVSSAMLLLAGSIEVLLAVRRTDSFPAPTSWYYWQLSAAIGRRGGIPRWSKEWGTVVRFFDYHLGFNSLGAVLGTATGDVHALVAPQIIRILTVVGTVFGVYLIARVFGAARYPAVAAGIAVPCIEILNSKLASFRPESTAYFLLLVPPAVLYRYLRVGGRLRLAALVVAFVGVSQLHTPAALVSLALCAAIAAAHLRLRWRAVAASVAVLVLMVLASFATDMVTGHRGPFSSDFANPPELSASGSDPTYAFSVLAFGHVGESVEALGRDAPTVSDLLKKTMEHGFIVGGDLSYAIALGLFGILVVGICVRRRWDLGRVVLAMVLGVAIILGIAVVTSIRYSTFVPLRTGYSRLLQIWWFAPLAVLPLLPRIARRPLAQRLITATMLAAAITLWCFAIAPTRFQSNYQPSRTTLRSLRELHLPRRGTILTNAYTQDFVLYNLGRRGLLDGQAPYLDAKLLDRANEILTTTGLYLMDPVAHPFPFARYGVSYVLIGTAYSALGTPAPFAVDLVKVHNDPAIQLVRKGPGYLLFEVKRPSPG